jgi:hypothetical protein
VTEAINQFNVIATRHPYTLLTKEYKMRPVIFIKLPRADINCVDCQRKITDDPLVGIQSNLDRNEFIPLCVGCSVKRSIIIQPTAKLIARKFNLQIVVPPAPQEEEEEDMAIQLAPAAGAAPEKRKPGRPPGSKNKPKERPPSDPLPQPTPTPIGGTPMAINLKGRLGIGTPEATAPAAAPAASAPKPAGLKLNLGGAPAPPTKLKNEIDKVANAPSINGGLSKADVLDIVNAALHEFGKTVKEELTSIRNIANSGFTTLDKSFTAKFDELVVVLGGEVQAEAPKETKAKKSTKKDAPAAAPTFNEFLANQLSDGPQDIKPLADIAAEMGYFGVVAPAEGAQCPAEPDRDEDFYTEVATLLISQGYKVTEDGKVSA